MKKLYLIAFVMLLLAANSFGQGLVKLEPTVGYSQTRLLSTDSAAFFSSFVFDIPEGCRTDTLHLMFMGEAPTYSSMDVDIKSRYGFKKSTKSGRDPAYYAWQKDSTAVVTSLTTKDIVMAYRLVPAAGDTLENTLSGYRGKFPYYDAVRINVIGSGTGNGSDVNFYLKVVGAKDNDK